MKKTLFLSFFVLLFFAACSVSYDITFSVTNDTDRQIMVAYVEKNDIDTIFHQLSPGRTISLFYTSTRAKPEEYIGYNSDTLYDIGYLRVTKDALVSSKDFNKTKEWNYTRDKKSVHYSLTIDNGDF